MALTSGTRIGPYEILAPLGAGGMGEVYRARDTRLERKVAIKILPSHLSENPILRQRFEREAKAISSLNHPHICVLYDIGNQDGIQFLVINTIFQLHAHVRQGLPAGTRRLPCENANTCATPGCCRRPSSSASRSNRRFVAWLMVDLLSRRLASPQT